jgi:hypothetical protein
MLACDRSCTGPASLTLSGNIVKLTEPANPRDLFLLESTTSKLTLGRSNDTHIPTGVRRCLHITFCFAPEIGDRTEALGVTQLVYHAEMMGCDHILLVSYLDRVLFITMATKQCVLALTIGWSFCSLLLAWRVSLHVICPTLQ